MVIVKLILFVLIAFYFFVFVVVFFVFNYLVFILSLTPIHYHFLVLRSTVSAILRFLHKLAQPRSQNFFAFLYEKKARKKPWYTINLIGWHKLKNVLDIEHIYRRMNYRSGHLT